MVKVQSYVMLILLNVIMEPSNVRKKIKKPLNVTKVLPIVTIKPSNVRKQIREPSIVTISFPKNYFIISKLYSQRKKSLQSIQRAPKISSGMQASKFKNQNKGKTFDMS